MYELTIHSHFSAAHRLREYDGDCEKLHGHNWKVSVTVESGALNDLGLVVDFREMKRILKEALESFDHAYLNDLEAFAATNPTTENIARILFEEVERRLPTGVSAASATAWESDGCGVTYRSGPGP